MRPEYVKEDHLNYLDNLRESGITNMFGAAEYLAPTFELEKSEARKILSYWMETFGDLNR